MSELVRSLNNKPLYTWVGDSQKGDTTGDGVDGVWHRAKKSDTSRLLMTSDSQLPNQQNTTFSGPCV